MSVRFDASGERYTAAYNLGSQPNYTVTCWARIATDRNTYSTVWEVDNNADGSAFMVQTDADGTTITVWNDNAGGLQATGPNMTVDTWYFLAVVVAGTSGILYYRAASTQSLSTATWTGSSVTMATIYIGDNRYSEWLNGNVAAFKFWATGLTQAEIDVESQQNRPVRTADLQAWYPFVIADTTDYSGQNRTLSGGAGATTEADPPIPWNRTSRLLSSRHPGFSPGAARFIRPHTSTESSGVTAIADPDSAALTESASTLATLSDSDTAILSESESVLMVPDTALATTPSALHPGRGPTWSRFLQSPRDTTLSDIRVTSPDAAAVSESASVSAALADSESSGLADSATLSTALADTDAAAATETAALSATLIDTDSGTLTDSAVLFVLGSVVDAISPTARHPGRGPTTARFLQSPRDTTLSDIRVTDSDAAALAEQAAVLATDTDTDTAAVSEATSLLAAPTTADQLATSDTVAASAALADTDAGAELDTATLLAAASSAEAATLAEAVSVGVILTELIGSTSRALHPGRGPLPTRMFRASRAASVTGTGTGTGIPGWPPRASSVSILGIASAGAGVVGIASATVSVS